MRFVADMHLHSRYARATSRDLSPRTIWQSAALKGIDLVGTGDFTHPEWLQELRDQLQETGDGLLELKPSVAASVQLPESCARRIRFLLTTEISSIYKKNGRTRKVHNLIALPDLDAVERMNQRLSAVGNLKSDGRPILGLDSRDLLEMALEACTEVLFIPAHIWTPHFSALGSGSAFASLAECYEDLLPHIPAIETGLSSDPPMNWRLSQLDAFAIVSNSDAHSVQKMGREATCFDTELSYSGLRDALKSRDPVRCTGTLEFYPEEGKYHYDGHRKCGVCWKPAQTLAAGGICPQCGRRLTIGVLHRVEELADRPEGFRPSGRPGFEYLVPLTEVIGSALGVGPGSKAVGRLYHRLLDQVGPELDVLRNAPIHEISRCSDPMVAEGVRRMRAGEVKIAVGHDGQYGTVSVFTPKERDSLRGQSTLAGLGSFRAAESAPPRERAAEARAPYGSEVAAAPAADEAAAHSRDAFCGDGTNQQVSPDRAHPEVQSRVNVQASLLPDALALDVDQRGVVDAVGGPLVVAAGPGSGKTRTLVARAAALIQQHSVRPGQIMTVTFTNRAAGELRERLRAALSGSSGAERLRVGTFHGLSLQLLEEAGRAPGLILDEVEVRQVLRGAMRQAGLTGRVREAANAISLAKASGDPAAALAAGEWAPAFSAYQERLAAFDARDYDDVLLDLRTLLLEDAAFLRDVRERFPHLLVDEFQDVNVVQYDLVKLLSGDGAGLVVIGDPDQAIYGFRGAESRFFHQLRRDFPAATLFQLNTNYRSQASVVVAARAVIRASADRTPLEVTAVRQAHAPVYVRRVPGETAEGIAIVQQIGRMVGGADMQQADQDGGGTWSLSDFAVLFRTGQQARALEECFLKAGLPYRTLGQKGFLEADSVRVALSFAHYVAAPESDLRLAHALELAPFRPGRAGLQAAQQALAGDGRAALPAAAVQAMEKLDAAAARYRALSPGDFFGQWISEYGDERDQDLAQLARIAREAGTLSDLLATVLWGREADFEEHGGQARPYTEAVSLLTLHAAKGLEFPVVFICGVEDGLIPLRNRGADREEERRLLYVGMTRAREELILLHAASRAHHGQQTKPDPSPFLADIPSGLLVREQTGPPQRGPRVEQLSLL